MSNNVYTHSQVFVVFNLNCYWFAYLKADPQDFNYNKEMVYFVS